MQIRGIPHFRILRIECLQRNGTVDKPAHGGDIFRRPGSQCLNHDITDCRSFGRPCHHRDADGIGRPLVQQVIAASAAYYMKRLYRTGRKGA